MDTPEQQIARLVRRFAAPPPEQLSAFIARGRRALFHKTEMLVPLGATTHELFFLHSGVVRYFLIVPATGEDVTKDFSFAPGFAVSFGSAVRAEAARVGIAAVTDCVVTAWPFAEIEALFERDAAWQKFGRKVAEWLYVRKEDRELSFLTETAEQRYAALRAAYPQQLDELPQYMVARYLGIAPESLSRLKLRLAKRGD